MFSLMIVHCSATIHLTFFRSVAYKTNSDAVFVLGFKICTTIDFSESGEKKRPVIIHRAILGSVERMIAILTESYAGKWPFWLSPRQCIVIPVGVPFHDYAFKVCKNINGNY
jgi:threonyl-tRNA synthetase